MKKKVVICYVDYSGAADFFIEMAKANTDNRYVFITTLVSMKFRCFSLENVTTYVISRFTKSSFSETLASYDSCKECYLEILSKLDCDRLLSKANKITDDVLDFYEAYEIVMLTWNGNSIFGNLMRLKKRNIEKIKIAFLEISNLPGLLFVDSKGVNAASHLSNVDNITEYFNDFEANGIDYKEWSVWYRKMKLSNDQPPPQSILIKKLKRYHLLDFIFSTFLGFRFFRMQSVFARLPFFHRVSSKKIIYNDFSKRQVLLSDIKSPFNFFPMQVSTDSQLMLNSDYDNYSALEYFLNHSDIPLVIKVHPADIEGFDFTRLDQLDPEGTRILVCIDNTYNILERANEVFTINSTLGLESMIFGKSVKVIGRSFYSKFNLDEVGMYVSRYLLRVDFFEPENLDKNSCDKIILRAR